MHLVITFLLCCAIIAIVFCLFYFFCDADLTVMFAEHLGKPLSRFYIRLYAFHKLVSLFLSLVSYVESVDGKVFWIVGASSGIGEYLAYEVDLIKNSLDPIFETVKLKLLF